MTLRSIAEAVGALSIVASLVFVGIELDQTQQLSRAEFHWNNTTAGVESRRGIYEFPEIWSKGNVGTPLTATEATIYSALIQDANAHAFSMHRTGIALGQEDGANIAVYDFAGFLHENPGALKEWEALRERFCRYRKPQMSYECGSNVWEEAMRDALERLRETQL